MRPPLSMRLQVTLCLWSGYYAGRGPLIHAPSLGRPIPQKQARIGALSLWLPARLPLCRPHGPISPRPRQGSQLDFGNGSGDAETVNFC